MVSTYTLVVATALHGLLGVSFFNEQRTDQCSTAPALVSWIVLIGFLDIVWGLCIFPPRYARMPLIRWIVGETIFAILIAEFGALVCVMPK